MEGQKNSENKENLDSDNQSEKETMSVVQAAFNTMPDSNETSLELNDISENKIETNFEKEEKREIPIENQYRKESLVKFDDIASSIEEAFPKRRPLEQNAFPHPRNWIGPRYMAIWTLPIIVLKKANEFTTSINPVRPYEESEYTITKAETIFTASREAIKGSKSIRFMGPLFLSIWVFPLAITGAVFEFLLIGPLKNTL